MPIPPPLADRLLACAQTQQGRRQVFCFATTPSFGNHPAHGRTLADAARAAGIDPAGLTATVTVSSLAPVLSKIENVNINGQFTTTGLNLATVTGTKVSYALPA